MEYQADAHFPNLEKDPEWVVTADSDEQTYFDIPYTFVKYELQPFNQCRNDCAEMIVQDDCGGTV